MSSYTEGDPSYPARNAAEVTPDDSTPMDEPSRALYVGGGGDVTVLMVGGQTVTFAAVPAGALLPIRVERVNDTGTDADDIVALY